jgi:hypothetical protein
MKLRAATVKTLGIVSADGKPLALVEAAKPKWRALVEVPAGRTLSLGATINLRLEEGVWRIL